MESGLKSKWDSFSYNPPLRKDWKDSIIYVTKQGAVIFLKKMGNEIIKKAKIMK